MANSIPLNITNFPIRISIQYGEELQNQADRLLNRIPPNLEPKDWREQEEADISNFQTGATLFGMLRERALGDSNFLTVAEEAEKNKLEELAKAVFNKIDTVNVRILELQKKGVPIANSWGIGGPAPDVLNAEIDRLYTQYAPPSYRKRNPTGSVHKLLSWMDNNRPATLAIGAIFCHTMMSKAFPFASTLGPEMTALGYGSLLPFTVSLVKAPFDQYYGIENNSIAALPTKLIVKVAKTAWSWKRDAFIVATCLIAGGVLSAQI